MKIENFSDLTSFINEENLKLQESFGININSKMMIHYSKTTIFRVKIMISRLKPTIFQRKTSKIP